MPGKNVGEYAWRYMTTMTLLRTVAATGDTYSQAAVEAVTTSIEHYATAAAAYANALALAVIMPATVTGATVEVYIDTQAVDGAGAPITTNKWCLFTTQTVAKSQVLMLKDVPCGTIKVLVTGIAGSGSVQVCWSKSK
jgi:hypothetical protein